MVIIFLFNPKALTPYTAFWGKKRRLYIIGASRIIMGLTVFQAASQCRFQAVSVIIGILLIIAGIPYFVIRLNRQKTYVSRWANRPAIFVRILGSAILAIGVLLLYSV
jgi:uncharacterized protein YjeT (DUF2065 family)